MTELGGGREERIRAERSAAINVERERRMNAGTVIEVEGYGQIPMQGRAEDRVNLLALKDLAQSMIATGSNTTITFRDRDNVIHDLTPAQVIDLWAKGVAYMDFIYRKSWALKDAATIPADFASDLHWQ